mgnify:CR=1 FL=1
MSTISWLEIFDKYNTQEIIMGKILKKVPGGFIVNVFGTEGFLPGSQVPQSLKEKGEGIVNNDINFKLWFQEQRFLNKRRRTPTLRQ